MHINTIFETSVQYCKDKETKTNFDLINLGQENIYYGFNLLKQKWILISSIAKLEKDILISSMVTVISHCQWIYFLLKYQTLPCAFNSNIKQYRLTEIAN